MAPGEKSGEGSRNFRPQTGRLPGPSLRRLAELAKIWTCPSKNRPWPAPAPAIPLPRSSPLTGQGADRPAGKNAALAKKKLAKGWGCLYTPFCAERSAPWQGSSVGQSMRFIPAVSRVQISPLLPESNNPGCPQGVRGFRVAGFRVFGFRVLWRCAPVFHVSAFVRQTFAMPAQPCRLCPGARHAFTKVIGVHCARTSARPGRQPGCRPPPSLA